MATYRNVFDYVNRLATFHESSGNGSESVTLATYEGNMPRNFFSQSAKQGRGVDFLKGVAVSQVDASLLDDSRFNTEQATAFSLRGLTDTDREVTVCFVPESALRREVFPEGPTNTC